MKEALIAKLKQPRPVDFTGEEAAYLRETLRQAVAVTLGADPAQVTDDARVYDDLGLDSIDVFDVLDQIGETFQVQVALEELPNEAIHGREGATFADFAEGILDYFRTPPRPPER